MKSPMVLSLLDAHPETIAEQLASYQDPEDTRLDTAHYVNCVAPLLKNSDTAGPGDRVVFAADNSEERSVDGPRQLIRSKPVSERSSCTPLNPPDHSLVVNAINPAGVGHATPSQQYGVQSGPSYPRGKGGRSESIIGKGKGNRHHPYATLSSKTQYDPHGAKRGPKGSKRRRR